MSDDITGPALPAPPPGFDPEAEFDNITPKTFTAVPKSSHRREGGSRELRSIVAIGLLTLYLSNEKGWRPPNAEKLATKYAEGAKVIRDAVKELERAGFVVRYRTQGKGGLWKTHVRVSADPDTLTPVRQWAADLAAAQDAQAAAKKAAGLSGGGRRAVAARADAATPQDEPADTEQDTGTDEPVTSNDPAFSQVGPDATDRDSVHRDSADRYSVQGDLKNQEKSLGDQEKNTPPASSTSHAARDAGAAEGGHISPDDKTRLTTAVDAAVEARRTRTGWARPAVVAAVAEALDAGHSVGVVVTALRRLAGDLDDTDYPTRLAPYLAHQARRASAVTGDETYRHKPAPPCGPSCDCWKHLPPAGEGAGISTTAAAAIAAARAGLPAGKPLWRRGGSGATPVRANAGTAASGEISTESAPTAHAV